MDREHDEKANMDALYQASRNGCVSTLHTLIQRDALILHKVSVTSFRETPLHVAVCLGHLEFSRALVSKKPKFAGEMDSLGRTPLHLASAEGHTEIAKELLQANTDICLVRDQDGRIPLHLAAMRGRREIIKELINARQESILMNLKGDSVLHLCIRYNYLDALKLLVESARGDGLFLNSKDHDGNSILHLAVILKQKKATKYVLSVPEIKREANAKNRIGYTALDVLEACSVCPEDLKCFEIQNILKEAGVKRSINLNSSLPPALSGVGVDQAQLVQLGPPAQSRFRRMWECVRTSLVKKRLTLRRNWIQETRGTLLVVATVIATMAFQAGISPPGGVWQEDTTTSANGFSCSQDNTCVAGTAVLAYYKQNRYQFFLSCNTVSFFASVCVILLVISGFPLTSKFFMWFFTLTMAISVSFMTLTYINAVAMVTPSDILDRFGSFGNTFIRIWYGVLVIVGVIHIILPLPWMVKKLRNFIRKSIAG